jgi:uncharacterized protein (TIGR03086 family)
MTIETLDRSFALARGVLAEVRPEQLGNPTPCASWDVQALIDHMINAANYYEHAIASGDPSSPVEDATADDAVAAYDEATQRALAAFSAPGAMERPIIFPFGTMQGSVFIYVAAGDAFAHAWDLATATGQPNDLDPELATTLLHAIRPLLGAPLRGEEGVAPFCAEQPAPDGATAAERYVAFLGRKV